MKQHETSWNRPEPSFRSLPFVRITEANEENGGGNEWNSLSRSAGEPPALRPLAAMRSSRNLRWIRPLRVLALIGACLALPLQLLAFDNDGQTDILWRLYAGMDAGDNAVWFMSGDDFDSADYLDAESDTDWKMVGTGDFNNDGQLDILWRNTSDGQNAVWFMDGIEIADTASLTTVSDTNWEIVGTGYFTGATDIYVDILWRNASDGQNAIWHMSGTSIASTSSLTTVSDLSWRIGGTGDFNTDGHPDVLWRDYDTGDNAVWYLSSGSYSSSADLSDDVADPDWQIVGTGHFNSDNKIDILWRYNGTGGDVAIWLMNGVTFSSSSIPASESDLNWKIGGTGDSTVDTDDDSQADLWEKIHFGNLDRTGSGDYDGDGYTDLQEYQNGTIPTAAELVVRIGRPQSGSSLP